MLESMTLAHRARVSAGIRRPGTPTDTDGRGDTAGRKLLVRLGSLAAAILVPLLWLSAGQASASPAPTPAGAGEDSGAGAVDPHPEPCPPEDVEPGPDPASPAVTVDPPGLDCQGDGSPPPEPDDPESEPPTDGGEAEGADLTDGDTPEDTDAPGAESPQNADAPGAESPEDADAPGAESPEDELAQNESPDNPTELTEPEVAVDDDPTTTEKGDVAEPKSEDTTDPTDVTAQAEEATPETDDGQPNPAEASPDPEPVTSTAPPAPMGSPAPSSVPTVNETWRSGGSGRLPTEAAGPSAPRAGRVPAADSRIVQLFRSLTRPQAHAPGQGASPWRSLLDLVARSIPIDLPDQRAGSERMIAFPVLGPVTYTDGWHACRDDCHRLHVGTDIMGVRMQPLLAAVDGVVTRIRHASMGNAGVALTIRDADGWTYSYFHNNNDTPGTDDGQAASDWRNVAGLAVGDEVRAGQIVGYMGDSGNAEHTAPHVHFEIRAPDGTPVPSYWSLRAAEARQACTIGLGPWALPEIAEAADPVDHDVVTTAVTPLYGDGEWLIDTDGRVTATGDAALILPRRDLGCDAGPTTAFGADALGWAGDIPAE